MSEGLTSADLDRRRPDLATRRAALGLIVSAAAGIALPLAYPTLAMAQLGVPVPGGAPGLPAGLRFRTIAVDTAPMARLGVPRSADLVGHVLAVKMQEVFADLMAPRDTRGAVLVARISSLSLASYAGSRDYGGRDSSGSGNDSLDGVGIVTSGGTVLSETPILSVLDPSYSGAWYLPDIDRLRVESICHHFAWWLRREMGV